ncbi:hypothetical protein ACIBQ0_09810 [Nocardia nova]|uniref:hypothetical protein n=1 Tax=Nocardia nova TaxID=37330 RepID=UPI0037B6ECFB
MGQAFYALALLACPVGMGLMMFMMMRGNKDPVDRPSAPADRTQIDALRAEIDALKAESGSRAPDTRRP